MLLAAVGAAALFLSLAFPGDVVRDKIVAEVKARTGRDLVINGPVTFAAVPSAHVSLQDVVLSAPEGMDAPPLVSMKALDVTVSLWPLLTRQVEIENILVKDPVFSLSVDGAGRNNWSLSRKAADARQNIRLAQADTGTATDSSPAGTSFDALKRRNISDISLKDVRIENGTIRFSDARNGRSHEATALTANLDVKSLTSPVNSEGSFDFRGERIAYTLEVSDIDHMLSHTPARVALKLVSNPFTANFEGTYLADNGDAEGSLDVNASSMARTAIWLGANLSNNTELGTLNVAGQLRSSGKVYTLSNATIRANGTNASGQVSLDVTPVRPMLRGDLTIAELDLNTLIVAPRSDEAQQGTTSDTPPATQPIDSQSGQPAPRDPPGATRVNGYVARGGWNEDPIRLAALGALDADLKLNIGSLIYKEIKAGSSRLTIALGESVLKATIEDAVLYGGHGRGFVILDGRSPDTAHVGINLALDNISMRPLLQDAAQLDWIEGNGNATIAVAGSGAHQRAIIESLAGKADLKVANGAVRGVDIDRMAENLSNGDVRGLKTQQGDKTAFSGLTATWQITDGVASNNDLRLISQHVQVTGAGSIVLPDRSLDYMVRPKLAVQGQEPANGAAGIEVPVRVSGSWEKPSYKADVGGAVEDLGRRLKGKDTGEFVDELVGKDSKTGAKAKKLLDKLFR